MRRIRRRSGTSAAANAARAGAPARSAPPAPARSVSRNSRRAGAINASSSTMEDPALEGGRDGLRAVVRPELAQDAAHEPLRRPARDPKAPRDLDVALAAGHEPEHLDLAGRQAGP